MPARKVKADKRRVPPRLVNPNAFVMTAMGAIPPCGTHLKSNEIQDYIRARSASA